MTTKSKETARFKIVNPDGCEISFSVNGSTVTALDEAFGWLTPERREKALKRMQATHEKLNALDAKRQAEQAAADA